jgi:hypothetical protein
MAFCLASATYWSYTRQIWTLSVSMTRTFLSAHELMTLRGGAS